MGPVRVAVLVVLVVVAPGATAAAVAGGSPAATAAAVAGGERAGSSGGPAAAVAAPRTDNTVTRIAVQADADARWTVRVRTRLRTRADVEDYRAFQRTFRNDTASFLAPFAGRIRATVADARNATGREMTARNFSASTSIQEVPRRWGVVSFAFTWTNFARVEGEALVGGDVFEGGLLLAENDSLVVTAPEGYAVASADPAPDTRESDAVTWEGQRSFADERPRVRLVPAPSPTPTPTPTAAGTPGGTPWAVVVALLVLALAVGALAVRRGGVRAGGGEGVAGQGDAGDAGGGGAAGADDGNGGDPPVLTDAERVERLLDDAGGRMKQAAVADELGWSDSKTSRVVATLVEEDRVEKLRVGRENVLDLVGEPD